MCSRQVGAYLKQRMGFENVGRLQGGIVSYVRELQQQVGAEKAAFEAASLFRGINYVFDNRCCECVQCVLHTTAHCCCL